MTIAAGFQCWDGIILCADTQENVDGYIKRSRSKLEARPSYGAYPDGKPRAIFAGAGDGDFIDYLVEKLWMAMESGKTINEMVEAVEDTLIGVYGKLIPLYPDGMPDAQLLVALCAPATKPVSPIGDGIPEVPVGDTLELVKITGPIVNRHLVLESIGFGTILTTYIANRLLYPKMGFQQALPIALYMVDEAKRHVRECGGDTQLVMLKADGDMQGLLPNEIEARTKRLRETDFLARQIAGLFMEEHLPTSSVALFLKEHEDKLWKLREEMLSTTAKATPKLKRSTSRKSKGQQ